DEKPGETLIRLTGNGLFASGSARLQADRLALLERVAAALRDVPGRVVVAGHTDNDPMPNSLRLKFASNWELSQARAETVRALLESNGVNPARLVAEGRADTEEIVPNTSSANKARNRRVDILLQPRANSI
ncbi:MAG: OmpA family protein, partial [Pseudomonadota bacterium]